MKTITLVELRALLAAQDLLVSRRYLDHLARRHELPAKRKYGRWVIAMSDAMDFINNFKIPKVGRPEK